MDALVLSVLFYICVVMAGIDCATMPAHYDTIIVGLGAAGCTAANTLAKAGKKLLALEAQDRIGGRVHSIPFGEGVVELGAEWIHGESPSRVYDYAKANNISVIKQDLNFKVYQSDGDSSYTDVIDELQKVTEVLPSDPQPMGEFFTNKINNYLKEKHPELFKNKDFIESLLNFLDLMMGNYESSNSWNEVSTHTKYTELDGHQHMSWHRYGYKTLFDILLNKYNNGPGFPNLEIKLNTEVTQISWPQDPKRNVVVTCKDGTIYTADNVIITVSLGVLKERYASLFSPQLPQKKIAAIANSSIGVVDKIVLSFDEAWWSGKHFYGFLWKKEDRIKVPEKDDWVTKIFGASCPMGSKNSLTVWTSGEVAKLVETLPEDEVKRNLMWLLRKFMGTNTTIPEPTGMIRSAWYSNPYTRGSYSFDNLLTPKYPTIREELASPLVDSSGKPRVLFAGEATDNTHFSTVHGAADSGYREAMRLLPTSKI